MTNKTTAKHFVPLLVYDEILYSTTWFYIGCSLIEVKHDLFEQKGIDIEADESDLTDLGSHFSANVDGQNLYIVHIRRKRDIVTLTHEIIHLVCKIFKDNRVPISYENQEMFARFHTFFMGKSKKALR